MKHIMAQENRYYLKLLKIIEEINRMAVEIKDTK